MRLDPIQSKITSEINKLKSAQKSTQKNTNSRVKRPDKSHFSASAKRLSETKANIEVISTHLTNEAEIRTEKIEEVKEKIAAGYYNSPEFIEKLAEKLISFFGNSSSSK